MAAKNEAPAKKKYTPDWFVQGILAKVGETLDKFTGRNWKPSSSLATSELVERLKKLLDAEVRDTGAGGKFVPHNIKLKTQWDKFSTDDSEEAIRKLKNELLIAAIDHINDNRYHTYAPLQIDIKRDYFTDGVKLQASFDDFVQNEPEAEINVTVPQLKVDGLVPPPQPAPVEEKQDEEIENVTAAFAVGGKQKSVELRFTKGKRLSVGRMKENDLVIDDASVSKHHATVMINPQGKLLVADTGSTNGTFINGERIAYGRAFALGGDGGGDRVKFGEVEVFFRRAPKPAPFVGENTAPATAAAADSEKTIASEAQGNGASGDGDKQQTEVKTAIEESRAQKKQTVETRRTEDYAAPHATSETRADDDGWNETKESSAAQPTEQGIKFDFGDRGDKS